MTWSLEQTTVLDTETCGFTGPISLIQWADGMDGPISLHSPGRTPIRGTLELLERLTDRWLLLFNGSFDWFKVQQGWTTLRLLADEVGLDELPCNHWETYARLEPLARDGPCLKPRGAMDLMLHARKGPWQSLMGRDDLIVKSVPNQLVQAVANQLEQRVVLPDIFFARKKRKKGESEEEWLERAKKKWKIEPRRNADGPSKDFSNIVLRFQPSSALKALATQELGLDPKATLLYADVELPKGMYPEEAQYAPFAMALGKPGAWNGTWPDWKEYEGRNARIVDHHDRHWAENTKARDYATKDIVYPRLLWEKWGRPAFDDDDSILACLAGAQRWKGYATDNPGMEEMRKLAEIKGKSGPTSPKEVMDYLNEVLAPEERMVLKDKKTGEPTTRRNVLEEVKKLPQCSRCVELAKATTREAREAATHDECRPFIAPHPAAIRAGHSLDARQGKQEEGMWEKLIIAQRLMPAVNVTGTKSGRNSGGTTSEGKRGRKSGSINPHGLQKKKDVRRKFRLGFGLEDVVQEAQDRWARAGYLVEPEICVGGDFDAFEVNIADGYYDDPKLREDLLTLEVGRDGKPVIDPDTGKPKKQKIHAVVGVLCYPHDCKDSVVGHSAQCERDNPICPNPHTYWSIKDSEGLAGKFDQWGKEIINLYTRAKSGLFALIYFGNDFTLETKLAIPKGTGSRVMLAIMSRYSVMGQKREEFFERFCPMRQSGEHGKISWVEPENKVISMLGFPRYFDVENSVIRALFGLAEDMPEGWSEVKVKVVRRDRLQLVANAIRSALYAAGFALQGSNMRAAGNHVIQSTGAGLTKMLQRLIWDVQPSGIHKWLVRPLNVHDELPTPCHPSVEERVAQIQRAFILEWRKLVPLLDMGWHRMRTWAEK